jgi:hypothetical protein
LLFFCAFTIFHVGMFFFHVGIVFHIGIIWHVGVTTQITVSFHCNL